MCMAGLGSFLCEGVNEFVNGATTEDECRWRQACCLFLGAALLNYFAQVIAVLSTVETLFYCFLSFI